MTEQYQPIADLIGRVRARWRRLVALRAVTRSALVATVALGVVLVLALAVGRSPVELAVLGALGLLLVAAAVYWAFRPLRQRPSDRRIARFIEEHRAELDERLVSAVGVASGDQEMAPAFAASMIGDAARAASAIEPSEIVPSELLRRTGFQAAAAMLAFVGVAFFGRHTLKESFDAASLTLFPSRVVLDVTPGDARVEAGSTLNVQAHLVGNQAPVVAQLLRSEGDGENDWHAVEMTGGDDGLFALALNRVATSFRYRVVAGAASSKTFNVAVVRAPRVSRIDVEYTYPKELGLAARTEEDGGDIYAPAGTQVRIAVHTDLPAATGRMVLAGDQTIALTGSGRVLTGALQITEDSSYRVTLADTEGLSSRGDTEYFIRTLEDRPPEVHVLRPASDRRVTPLEEVDIEAEANDDFGLASLDLVYAVRGGAERVVPLRITPGSTAASGRHTIFLEDLEVRPGDFVSYYVRARDLPRGKRSSETRSDIFFLDVKPFEEEFTLAQSQAAMGGGQPNQQLDDLVAAQKQIIVATWKLDRRSQATQGAKSEEDIHAVGRAEGELKTRVEQASSMFRQSTMRDPRRPLPGGRGAPPPPPTGPRAGQTMAEEDAMTSAAKAMGLAVTALTALKTTDAVPPEMDALNQLLKAQADVKKRQISQQAGGGSGGNRNIQDMSSLFDKELARQQTTNYETPKSAEPGDTKESELEKIKDLARRQDELLKRQQELARERERMTPEQLKRELESLSRDQNDLRQRAEELAQEMARQQNQSGQQAGQNPQQGQQGQKGQQGQQNQQNQQGQQSQQGQQAQSGQQSQSGQQGQPGGQPSQPGQNKPGQSGPPRPSGQNAGKPGPTGQQPGQQEGQSGRPGENGSDMRSITEEMRNAAGDLRRQDADQASARAQRALDGLRELERQLQAGTPDGRRRALGDLQLESRQLADAERQIGSEASRAAGQGEGGKDTLRRLAGEQQRLAERARRVEEGLKQQGAASGNGGKDGKDGKDSADAKRLQQAAAEAGRDLERQRVADRLQQSADAMRAAAQPNPSQADGSKNGGSSLPGGTTPSPEDLARALDRAADRLSTADKSDDPDSRKMSEQLARAQELREQLDELTRQMSDLDRQASANSQAGAAPNGRQGGPQGGQGAKPTPQGAPGDTGRGGQGQGGPGGSSADVERLRAAANQELERIRDLVRETERSQGTQARGGVGATFEGQGMVLSAPGTEGFKQDFAKWQELKRQAAAALEDVQTTLSKKLQERDAKDRLSAGADDTAPAAYQDQVDSYFKALAAKKKH